MEVRNITCIGCPIGCPLKVEIENSEVIKVTGNSCNIGIEYAKKECTNPTRIVTSSVFIENGEIDVLPVKTESDIPKSKIEECIKALKGIKVKAPIKIGDIIVQNAASTGVNIVATRNVKEKIA
ncbi:DUF1667 domain-containing protein [Clostridium sp. MSJ-11]|uniref:DUF1667 domain-containing protein n=1 Tax=Clostridium mobile TaxID=2841512 RepID=A0ABS6EJB4_9CLOT|nr:DUF1667 domain-containing protein [Clostridium mobile]MBU5485313.1 DUF1667 domain-containing protein [Clostridium mobile]